MEITNLQATRVALRELAGIVKSTRRILAELLQTDERFGRLRSRRQSSRFGLALDHLGEVREGFILSQRSSSHMTLSELRYLVQSILLDWQWLAELNLKLDPGKGIAFLDKQLVAYNHALVALAVLPRLPAEAITFPQARPTYGDVAVPLLPGELLSRIEELEHIIYQAEVRPVRGIAYGPLRRTYAFFEASSWLATNYLEPLLGD